MEQFLRRSAGPAMADTSYASSETAAGQDETGGQRETIRHGKAAVSTTNANDTAQDEDGGFWGWMAVFGGCV